ncbi:MAG TPA: ABC transporter permease [Candidatus Acidoferrales bacterium]|nr:ABC transporter permease [Candidatus Acidoferrales bacterium]
MFDKRKSERELKAEVEFDLEKRVQANLAAGMSEAEARRAAQREFGSVSLAEEECRDERRNRFFENLLQDLRFGMRTLTKKPGFTAVAILTLALGIGANTAIFSVVNAVLLRPLPFSDPSRLFLLYEGVPDVGFPKIEFSAPDLMIYAQAQHSFSALAPYQNKRFEVSGAGVPERVMGARAGWKLFDVLGVRPILGRTFSTEEDQPGHPVTIISYGVWQRKFGGAADVIGKSIDLDRKPYAIVGVMPKDFQFPLPGAPGSNAPADVWVPMAFNPFELQAWGQMFNNDVAARLAPGVTPTQAQSEAEGIAARIFSAYPPSLLQAFHVPRLHVLVKPLHAEIVGEVRPLLLVLQAAVGLVLLIACANVALLLLARASGRSREIAIRAALGAGRGRLVLQLLTESFLLAAFGGCAGLALATWSKDLLLKFLPAGIELPKAVSIDGGVLLFTMVTALAAAVVFGVVPAMNATRTQARSPLQDSVKGGSAGRRQHRLQNSFVVTEFALALILMIGAGLLLKTFANLLKTSPGFQPQRVVGFSVPVPVEAYPRAAQVRSFYEEAIAQSAAVPGVVSAAISSDMPLHANETDALVLEIPVHGKTNLPAIRRSWIIGDYLGTMGIPILRGRGFTPEDGANTQPVALVSKAFAESIWPGGDAIGKRVKLAFADAPWLTIVGIVGDVPDSTSLAQPPSPHVYTPVLQESDAAIADSVVNRLRSLNLVVRTQSDSSVAEVVDRLHKLDPSLAIGTVHAMQEELGMSVAPQRFNAALVGIYAGAALLLALVGIYGVLAYAVTQQTHDIGVRMALGARRANIFALMLRRGLTLAVIGAAAGLAGAFGVTRVLSTLLYGVQPRDPWIFAGVTLLLTLASIAACIIPARRAMRVDPIIALRHE